MKTADFFVERLEAWGVKRIFGYSGDGINGVIGAIQRDGAIDFIQARHEEMAAFMAVAYAKFTGELGVCLATGGPGATHLITGLYDARADHMPVLAICGQGPTAVRGASYQPEPDLDRALMAVAERLGAGVAKALLGKSVLADDLPFVTGSIGLLGTKPSSELMNACDTLLIVGSGFPWSEFLPEKARGVQIDIDPAMLSLRYPC